MSLDHDWHDWLRRHFHIYALSILTLILAAGALTQRFHVQWDLTLNARHTLSPASLAALRECHGPVAVLAYTRSAYPERADPRPLIAGFVARYRHAKPDLTLAFVDTDHEPRRADAAGVRADGELVLAYAGRTEHLTTLNEQDFTNALLRLARDRKRTAMFLSGHGEGRCGASGSRDFGAFCRQLTQIGFRATPLDLVTAEDVPEGVDVLVLSATRTDVSPGEVDKIRRYLARGGNLLWLIEPGPLRGLRPVAETLGLSLSAGTVIDPAAREFGLSVPAAIATQYGRHPAMAGFDLATALPYARPIGADDVPGWRATSLVEAAPRGWVRNGEAGGATFDPRHDQAGPVVVGLALERDHGDIGQRVAVIGSDAFLANPYLGTGGNLELGLRLVNWLAGDVRLIAIAPKATMDATSNLGRRAFSLLVLGFLVVVPLCFFITAAMVWRRRRNT